MSLFDSRNVTINGADDKETICPCEKCANQIEANVASISPSINQRCCCLFDSKNFSHKVKSHRSVKLELIWFRTVCITQQCLHSTVIKWTFQTKIYYVCKESTYRILLKNMNFSCHDYHANILFRHKSLQFTYAHLSTVLWNFFLQYFLLV